MHCHESILKGNRNTELQQIFSLIADLALLGVFLAVSDAVATE